MEHLKCFLRDSEVEENNTKSLNVETLPVSRSSQDFGVLYCDLERPDKSFRGAIKRFRGDSQVILKCSNTLDKSQDWLVDY